mgnify:CR=1 FL=1
MIRKQSRLNTTVSGGVNIVAVRAITVEVRIRGNSTSEIDEFLGDLEKQVAITAVQVPRQRRHNVSVIEAAADRFVPSGNLL